MGKKAAAKAARKKNFPLVFWDGVREDAQAAADEDFDGNLTTYINTVLKADAKRRKARK